MTPRLKSEFWVHALLRRNAAQGRFGAVIRKGAAEAGAVYVVVNRLNGELVLLAPPAGPAHDDDGNRRFRLETPGAMSQAEVDALIERKRRADPDLWLVEIEDRSGYGGLVPEGDDSL